VGNQTRAYGNDLEILKEIAPILRSVRSAKSLQEEDVCCWGSSSNPRAVAEEDQ
jgi:hypothetical protein